MIILQSLHTVFISTSIYHVQKYLQVHKNKANTFKD